MSRRPTTKRPPAGAPHNPAEPDEAAPDLTLRHALRARPNRHAAITTAFEDRTGLPWHAATPAETPGTALSVVVPAHNMAYSLPVVLDALAAQYTAVEVEVIVVDDASTDGTAELVRTHPLRPTLIRTRERRGAAIARNLGIAAAHCSTIVFLDADMVLAPHALADIAARADQRLVLVGFRHNIPFQPGGKGRSCLPDRPADLRADHRVRWKPPVGVPLIYSGLTLTQPLDGRPLEATDDFQRLGNGATYYDWDLPRMVVTALVAAPRDALIEVGGFHPDFARIGWGSEDTHLGAALIAAGLLVVPLRQLVGYHINPPDEAASWRAKLATWPATVALYRSLLGQPPPHGQTHAFHQATADLLRECEVDA